MVLSTDIIIEIIIHNDINIILIMFSTEALQDPHEYKDDTE